MGWLHSYSPIGYRYCIFRKSLDSFQISTSASLWIIFIVSGFADFQVMSIVDDGGQNGQPLTGINSFWAADFIVISVLWWYLCFLCIYLSSPSLIDILLAGFAVLALPLHLQDCFQLFIKLGDTLFFLSPCTFWLIYVAFLLSLSNVPPHLRRVLTHIARRVVVPWKRVLLRPPVSSPFSHNTYRSFVSHYSDYY